MTRITALEALDIRFPTSVHMVGSDAMNHEPDYSAAYITLRTDDPQLTGNSLVFTIGRGNDVQTAAVRALAPLVAGRDANEVLDDLGAFARSRIDESNLRGLGHEKGG